MASTDSLNLDHRDSVAQQLGSFLPPFAAEGVPPAPIGIAESFQVWTASLHEFRTPGAVGPRWHRVWHHQLRSAGGRANAYARSVELDGGAPEARGIYQADIAGEIDLAVSAIDEKLRLADDVKVRLLEIPDVSLMALWLNSGETDQYVPLGSFASPGAEHFAPISKQKLISRLPEQPVSGLSLRPPPDRRPDF